MFDNKCYLNSRGECGGSVNKFNCIKFTVVKVCFIGKVRFAQRLEEDEGVSKADIWRKSILKMWPLGQVQHLKLAQHIKGTARIIVCKWYGRMWEQQKMRSKK